eukprot:TRINITY_DN324_c2_g1_i3.p1 TRINITY_DN324_c2_g1~~TRINITY_DN324_c2_g1_i3.p1  ORF type:complete len:357 (+),score=82.16 TRINITY_DN324_c2_g1_i3:30-1073(+)
MENLYGKIFKQLQNARDLMNHGDYSNASSILRKIISSKDSNFEKFSSAAYGWLADCLFSQGNLDEAEKYALQTITICEENNDTDGKLEILNLILEIQRYLQKNEEASATASKIYQLLEEKNDKSALFYSKLADKIKKGEDTCRVIVTIDNIPYEVEDIPESVSGKVVVTVRTTRPILKSAQNYIDKGKKSVSETKFADAVSHFQQASKLDPYNPSSKYEEGFSQLYLKNYDLALSCFEKASSLAPGWYQVNHYIWLAKRMKEKVIDHQTYQAIRVLEESTSPLDAQQKLELAERFLLTTKISPLFLAYAKSHQLLKKPEAKDVYKLGVVAVVAIVIVIVIVIDHHHH